jgi:hypothetical protein
VLQQDVGALQEVQVGVVKLKVCCTRGVGACGIDVLQDMTRAGRYFSWGTQWVVRTLSEDGDAHEHSLAAAALHHDLGVGANTCACFKTQPGERNAAAAVRQDTSLH